MKYEYTENILTIGDKSIEFDNLIKEVIDFGDCFVVRTDNNKFITNENVYGVNINGQLNWQIKKMEKLTFNGKEYNGITDPYSGLTKVDNNRVILYNWDSTNFEVNPKSGELLTDPMKSRIGHKPW